MNSIQRIAAALTPSCVIAMLKARRRLAQFGLTCSFTDCRSWLKSLDICRYDLWPETVRTSENQWILIDVGANRGQFLGAALRFKRPAHCIVIEPLESCKCDLDKILCQLDSKDYFQVIVGREAGYALMNETNDTVFSSVLEPVQLVGDKYGVGQAAVSERRSIAMQTLDELCSGIFSSLPIGLLKIDVQGFELNVLQGAAETLKRTEAVLIEVNYVEHYHGGSLFEDNHNLLVKNGFRMTGVSCPVFIAGLPHWADAMYTKRVSVFS